jgi:hypothetical protein
MGAHRNTLAMSASLGAPGADPAVSSNPPTPARAIARHLLERDASTGESPSDAAVALQRACTRISESLRRSVGDDGFNALIARGLARTETAHPALVAVRGFDNSNVRLDGVLKSVGIHGLPAVSVAIESLFEVVVEVLTSLIGADMAVTLLDDALVIPPIPRDENAS